MPWSACQAGGKAGRGALDTGEVLSQSGCVNLRRIGLKLQVSISTNQCTVCITELVTKVTIKNRCSRGSLCDKQI